MCVFVICCVMLYGVSSFVLFVCVFVCLCLFVLRVMYGAMVYGLYVVVVLVCVVVKSVCCLFMMYCVLLYGLPFVLFCRRAYGL